MCRPQQARQSSRPAATILMRNSLLVLALPVVAQHLPVLHAANALGRTCPPGSFASRGASFECLPCPAGTWNGEFGALGCAPCPAGRFGDRRGARACDGLCSAGFFCPEGSTSSTQNRCGSSDVFCPEGAAAPRPIRPGFYGVGGSSSTRVAEVLCEPGHHCALGLRHECPAGTFNPEYGSSSVGDCVPAPRGSFARGATAAPELCPAGTFGDVEGLALAACSGLCDPGHYCPAGSVSAQERACPEGRFGAEAGLIGPECSGLCDAVSGYCVAEASVCPEGHFCPEASVSPQECGGPHVFCPRGSSAPETVSTGHYSIDGPPQARAAELECEPGHYCEAGVKAACDAGRFGASAGLSDRNCSGVCAPGYFCESGSPSEFQHRCGDPAVYCPLGSKLPTAVSPGHYTTGGDVLTRSAEAPCPPGSWCQGGLRRACPAGTLGVHSQLTSAACNGPCPVGHYCPIGSTEPTPCPAGTYGEREGLRDAACSAQCPAGHFCPAGSVGPTRCEGGIEGSQGGTSLADDLVCPPGSAAPQPLAPGHRARGGAQGTRWAEVPAAPAID